MTWRRRYVQNWRAGPRDEVDEIESEDESQLPPHAPPPAPLPVQTTEPLKATAPRPMWETEALELARRYTEPNVRALVIQVLDPCNVTSHASFLPPATLALTPQDDRYFVEDDAMEEAKHIADPTNVKRATTWRQYGGKMRGKIDIGKMAIACGFRFWKRRPKRGSLRAEFEALEVKSFLEYVKFGTTSHWQEYFVKKSCFEKKKRSLADAYSPKVPKPVPYMTWRGSAILEGDVRFARSCESRFFADKAWQRMLSRATEVEQEGAQAIQRARHAIRLIHRLFTMDADEKVKNQEEYECLKSEFNVLPWMRDVTQPLQPQRDGVAVNMADVVNSPHLSSVQGTVLRARYGLCMELDGKTSKPALDHATIGTQARWFVSQPISAQQVRQIEADALEKLEITLVPPTALADKLAALCERLYEGNGYKVPQPPSWKTLDKDNDVEDIDDSEIVGIEEERLADIAATPLAKQARLQQDAVLDDDSDWEDSF